MKLSTLIFKLHQIQKQHGDPEVNVCIPDEGHRLEGAYYSKTHHCILLLDKGYLDSMINLNFMPERSEPKE